MHVQTNLYFVMAMHPVCHLHHHTTVSPRQQTSAALATNRAMVMMVGDVFLLFYIFVNISEIVVEDHLSDNKLALTVTICIKTFMKMYTQNIYKTKMLYIYLNIYKRVLVGANNRISMDSSRFRVCPYCNGHSNTRSTFDRPATLGRVIQGRYTYILFRFNTYLLWYLLACTLTLPWKNKIVNTIYWIAIG